MSMQPDPLVNVMYVLYQLWQDCTVIQFNNNDTRDPGGEMWQLTYFVSTVYD